MLLHEQIRQQSSDESHHTANAQINAAGDDDEGRTDAQDAEERGPIDEVLRVVRIEEIRIDHRCDDADENQDTGDANDLFHSINEMCVLCIGG